MIVENSAFDVRKRWESDVYGVWDSAEFGDGLSGREEVQVVFFIVMAGRVIEGTFTAGDYFVVWYYFFVLYATIGAWGHMYTEWQRNIAGMRRVFFLMDLPTEKTRDGIELPRISDGVVMDNVGLTYPDGRQALRHVNMEARIGEIVAFVGPTGAGKTSLAYLAPAFLQATEGKVSIDGIDLKDVSVDSLRWPVLNCA